MAKPKPPVKSSRPPRDRGLREALLQFVRAIDVTGGVVRDRGGWYAPAADPEWIDLGEAYADACRALGRQPVCAAEDSVGETL